MFKQTETKYKDIMLGFGSGSIYLYGCFLVSLCNGLNQKGYSFTPESLNDLFKSLGAWVGPYKNYIDVDNLSKYLPNIFVEYQRIDPWGSTPSVQDVIKNDLVALGRVSAVPIGGTGDHFVLITGSENGVAKIYDPWSGVEELITKRWSKYGYVLGLRLFKVKPATQAQPEPSIEKLPKDNVIRDIRTALCGGYSEDEIKADIASNENILQIVERICSSDSRFNEKWIKPQIPKPTNGQIPQEVINKINNLEDIIKSVHDTLYGSGWWWVKYWKLKELIPEK